MIIIILVIHVKHSASIPIAFRKHSTHHHTLQPDRKDSQKARMHAYIHTFVRVLLRVRAREALWGDLVGKIDP